MTGEIDICGVFISPVLASLALVIPAHAALRLMLGRLGVYRLVWHPPLTDLALFVILLGMVSTFLPGWI